MIRGGKGPRLFRATLLGCLLLLVVAPSALAMPAWLPVTNLSAPGRAASGSEVAMDEAGETVAVWERQSETETSHSVQASTRAPGGAFSAPIELSEAAGEPDVAITPAGEAVAVWRHFDLNAAGNYVIQASYRPPGGSFSAPLDVAVTPNKALPQNFHVAVNAAGDTAVVWLQQEPESGLSPNPTLIEASVRPAGGSFSAPVVISAYPPIAEQSAQSPRIAIDAAGDVRVVWAYDDGTAELVQTAARPAGGSFSAPEDLTTDGEEAFGPDIAMDSSGAATVVWAQLKESEYTIQASQAPPGGSFAAPVVLSAADSAPSGQPAIAMTAAGAATVAWTQSEGGNNIVQAATGSPGGAFAAPVDLSPAGQEALYPEVAMDGAGAATVVWKGSDGSNDIVQAATGSGGAFSAPVNLSTAEQNAVFPAVAMDSTGDATAVWWRSDGANTIVQAAGYDASPPVLQNLSIPSSGTVGVPVSFSVSPFDVWPIAATSFNFGDGTTAGGASASHAYASPGTYQVTVTAADAAGTPVSGGGTITIRPSNQFKIGKLSLNRRKGTGTVAVTVPGPGRLVLSGNRVKRVTKRSQRAGTVKLSIRARGKVLKKLSKRGKAPLPLAIAFTPDGGTTLVKHKKVTLVKKRSPSRSGRNSQHA